MTTDERALREEQDLRQQEERARQLTEELERHQQALQQETQHLGEDGTLDETVAYAQGETALFTPPQVAEPPPPDIDQQAVRSRQSDLVDSAIFDNPITIIGAGAIGSFTALTLAKMGFPNITVYDHDSVSTENISNQFYRYKDIGSSKVTALRNMLQDFEQLDISPRHQQWRTQSLSGHIIMAVDSMAVRKQIFHFIRRNTNVYGFIDGRMGGQQAEVYSVDLLHPEQKVIYEKYLWSDSEAEELPCTQKAVMYNVLWIASQIANNLRLMLEEKPFPPVMQMDFENVNHINVQHKQ